MNRLEGVTARTALIGIAALIVVGGIVLALLSGFTLGLFGSFSAAPTFGPSESANLSAAGSTNSLFATNAGGSPNVGPGSTQVISQVTAMTTTFVSTSTQGNLPDGGMAPSQNGSNVSQGAPSGAGGQIEFSSDLTLRASSPQQAASGIVALAYSVGGYVAYQSTYSSSANVVIRIPAAEYQQVLTKVEAMGVVIVLTSNSNDVRVQYTDLNATLASLRTEQGALLRLLNQSTTVNSTLAIESQMQGVNQQINDIESQILQTRTLINYATINVSITETAQQIPLSMAISATPDNGTSPLSVTFNAVVKGGSQPYIVNYNFGDGYASQGPLVIHTYFQAGDYKVTVSTTDQNGTVVQKFTTVKVEAAQAQSGIESFLGTVSNLLVSVVEGIVEVAVVVLPIAAVGAVIIIPIQRHNRTHRDVRQSQ